MCAAAPEEGESKPRASNGEYSVKSSSPAVVYPCLSSSSDDHPFLHSCLGTGMRVGSQNKFCHYPASLVHSAGVRNCFYFVVGLLVGQYHDTATSTTPVLGVLVNTLQYHDTVNFVQDSETEDPQLVAELWRVGRNHGKTMGKN